MNHYVGNIEQETLKNGFSVNASSDKPLSYNAAKMIKSNKALFMKFQQNTPLCKRGGTLSLPFKMPRLVGGELHFLH